MLEENKIRRKKRSAARAYSRNLIEESHKSPLLRLQIGVGVARVRARPQQVVCRRCSARVIVLRPGVRHIAVLCHLHVVHGVEVAGVVLLRGRHDSGRRVLRLSQLAVMVNRLPGHVRRRGAGRLFPGFG